MSLFEREISSFGDNLVYSHSAKSQSIIFSILTRFSFFTSCHTFSTILLICLFLHSFRIIEKVPELILVISASFVFFQRI
ncbi:TPA: hypothetical protein DEG21_04180 [Patescibacteria group bacterium]|nr:hypothetical protein [Candidatus Gracilibacteria bacterium]